MDVKFKISENDNVKSNINELIMLGNDHNVRIQFLDVKTVHLAICGLHLILIRLNDYKYSLSLTSFINGGRNVLSCHINLLVGFITRLLELKYNCKWEIARDLLINKETSTILQLYSIIKSRYNNLLITISLYEAYYSVQENLIKLTYKIHITN